MNPHPPGSLVLVALATLCVALLSGCMSSSYQVPPEELARISQLPPAERGARVRVVQRWTTARAPTPVLEVQRQAMSRSSPHVISVGRRCGAFTHHEVSYRGRSISRGYGVVARPHGGTVHAARPGAEGVGKGGVKPAEALDTTGNGPGQGGGGGGGLSIGDGEAIVYAVLAAAVVVTFYLALTEGTRFDGWAELDESQPVHLFYKDGSERAVALWQLEAGDLVGVEEAVVLDEGDGLSPGSRAPLDRVGFAWRMEGGGVQVTLPRGDAPLGPAGLIGLGYFPVQWLGVMLTSALAASTDGTFVDIQYGAELDVIPLEFGPLHLGLYGAGTMAFTILEREEGGDVNLHEPAIHAGALIELELFTRMAMSAHLGMFFQRRDEAFLAPTFVGTIGLTIY